MLGRSLWCWRNWKSFLIEAITAQVAKTWSELDSSITCAVAAPTGLAAFNVGIITNMTQPVLVYPPVDTRCRGGQF